MDTESLRSRLIKEFQDEQTAADNDAERTANERAKRLSKLLPDALDQLVDWHEFSELRVVGYKSLAGTLMVTVGDIELLARLVTSPYGKELVHFELVVGRCPECGAPQTCDWWITTRHELASLLASERQCPSSFIYCPHCGASAKD